MQHSFTALSSGCHGDLQGLDFEEEPHTVISFRVCENRTYALQCF